jgi:hypothetical protein
MTNPVLTTVKRDYSSADHRRSGTNQPDVPHYNLAGLAKYLIVS